MGADGTGVGFDSSTGFILPNGAERSPDLAWVSRARWDALSDEEREEFPPLCPDFVVELRSRSDSLTALREKMREYIAANSRRCARGPMVPTQALHFFRCMSVLMLR